MLQRWWTFTQERFEPISHFVMISFFFLGHWIVADYFMRYPAWSSLGMPVWKILLLYLGTWVFFFKLRLYDEIKDYAFDLKYNPDRPLARGLLKKSEVQTGILICIFIELLFAQWVGMPAFVGMLVAVVYSLLMYKEFFVGKILRNYLTTYALTHTIVSSLLSVALLSALTARYPWNLNYPLIFFALNSWMIFNVFEFGRKTFVSSEEKKEVETYSKLFGRSGAVILVLVMVLLSASLLSQVRFGFLHHLMFTLFWLTLAVAVSGVIYVRKNTKQSAKIYRAVVSTYLVAVYAAVILFCWFHSNGVTS
ncbi:UbiA family prenyltransferase [bacterium]|nr:UbiA family prenyltransferase [bacterium]